MCIKYLKLYFLVYICTCIAIFYVSTIQISLIAKQFGELNFFFWVENEHLFQLGLFGVCKFWGRRKWSQKAESRKRKVMLVFYDPS